MDTTQYLSKLEGLKRELDSLNGDFSKFKPFTDWNKTSVNPLLEQLGNLITVIRSFPGSISEELVEAEVNYFEKNVSGLRIVLKSEQDFMRHRNAVHR